MADTSEQQQHGNDHDDPGQEFSDPRRQELIQELARRFQSTSREIWALLWLSDMEMLEEVVKRTRQSDAAAAFELAALEKLTETAKLVKKWLQRSRNPGASVPATPTKLAATSSTTSSPLRSEVATAALASRKRRRVDSTSSAGSASSGSLRDKTVAARCHERDNETCVITHAAAPVEAAHIFPVSLRSTLTSTSLVPHQYNIWSVLRTFWTEERVNSWIKSLASPEGTEVVANEMCMAPSVHKYFDKGKFALKPIRLSNDSKALTVKFFWLPNFADADKNISVSTTPSIPKASDKFGIPGRAIKLWDIRTERKICSGDEITIMTDDPVTFPLPSWDLLDMHWVLHRLAALTAAGQAGEDILSDDDDSEVIDDGYQYEEDADSFSEESASEGFPTLEGDADAMSYHLQFSQSEQPSQASSTPVNG